VASVPVIGAFAKEYLHSDLREARETVLWKLDGLTEYAVRRPLTLSAGPERRSPTSPVEPAYRPALCRTSSTAPTRCLN
jgi:hypothetical protein